MSNTEADKRISTLEDYLFADDKDKFFETLVEGSETWKQMVLLDHVNRHGLEGPTKRRELLRTYLSDPCNQQSLVSFKCALREIQKEGDEKKRQALMQEFDRKYLHVSLNHQRPANVQQGAQLSHDAGAKHTSVYDGASLSVEKAVARVASEPTLKNVAKLLPVCYRLLELEAVLSGDVRAFEQVLEGLVGEGCLCQVKGLCGVLVKYKKAKEAKEKGFVFSERLLGGMSLEQLEELGGKVPAVYDTHEFVGVLYRKKFEDDAEVVRGGGSAPGGLAGYRAALARVLKWVQSLPGAKAAGSLQSFAMQVVREMLHVDVDLNAMDEALLLTYAASPLNRLSMYVSDSKRPYEDGYWYGVHGIARRGQQEEERLVGRYLDAFLPRSGPGKYSKVFEPKFLARAHVRARLLRGESVANAVDVLGEAALRALHEERRLEFVPWNAKTFAPGESVTLSLEVKNVARVRVSVFEIQTGNYYRQHGYCAIDERVALEGLLPGRTLERVVEGGAVVSQVVVFKDLVQSAARGVYVVEFVGGGLSSRALIRVGGLTVVRQELSKGLLLHVVDEAKRVCGGEQTWLSLEERRFTCAAALDGGILVPYAERAKRVTGVVEHEGFAELVSVEIPAETVSLETGLVLNEESVAGGGEAVLVLVPQLRVNGRRVGLQGLKKVRAEVESDNEGGISSLKVYEGLSVERGRGIELAYPLPPKTTMVRVRLSGRFYSGVQEKWVDLSSEKSVWINRYRGQMVYYSYYLRQDGDEMTLQLLGKNGEPYGGQRVEVTFTPVFVAEAPRETFVTDAKGEVRLGKVCGRARDVRVRMVDSPCTEKPEALWQLGCEGRVATQPRAVDAVEGEDVVLPASCATLGGGRSAYELVRVCRGDTSCVVAVETACVSERDGEVVLRGLCAGKHVLRYVVSGVTVTIDVHKGERWSASPSYIVEKDSITKLANKGRSLSYRDLRVSDGAVEFGVVSDDVRSVEVHVFAYNYYPAALEALVASLKGLRESEEPRRFRLARRGNAYLSGKRLSDESKYVFERKEKKSFMGNTLEKPPALLKRHFVRETTQDAEELAGEEDYTAEAVCCEEAACEDRCCLDAAPQGVAQLSKRRVRCIGDGACPPPPVRADYKLSALSGFLAQDGWSAHNVAVDAASGRVRVEVPSGQSYGTLVVVLCDGSSSVVEAVPLARGGNATRDMRLAESKTADRAYAPERVAHGVVSGGVCEIADFDATELYVVEDVACVYRALKVLGGGSQLGEWSFLGQWGTLSPEEQLRKYDELACHEFNVFAYFKDREFFDAVVKPHLASKSEKQFVDYFLLGDREAVARYTSAAELDRLNAAERALLVLHLRTCGGSAEECAAIARGLSEEAKALHVPRKEYERLFDTVLTGRLVEKPATGGSGAMMNNFNSRTAVPMAPASASHATRSVQLCAAPMMMARAAPMMMMEQAAPMMDNVAYEDALNQDDEEVEVTDGGAERAQPRRYRKLGATSEYVERQYSCGKSVKVRANALWAAAAAHFAGSAGEGPLLTESFVFATSSVSEMLLALAVVGVPVTKGAHSSDFSNGALRLTAGSPCIVFSKAIRASDGGRADVEVLVSQRFCDPFDRHVHTSDGVMTLKRVDEFVAGKLYASRVAVVNATETQQEVSLVAEVPQGAIPVGCSDYTQSTVMTLQPLSTVVHEFSFYFPSAGEYTCFPASVNKDGKLVSSADGSGTLRVVLTRSATVMRTLGDILSQGTKADVVAFMERENLHDNDVFQFDAIYWLLSDRSFYESVLAVLRRKKLFNATVWGYCVKHGDREALVELLQWQYGTGRQLPCNALYLCDGGVCVDNFAYKEYNPLVNSRVHDIGRHRHNIRNREFRETYADFLTYLQQKAPAMSARDHVYLATYLLLQDRVDAALGVFARVDPSALHGELCVQYDYLSAYLDLYTGQPAFERARSVCARYLTYPVFTWRNRFVDVLNQLSEFDGEDVGQKRAREDEGDAARNEREARLEEHVSCELKGDAVAVTHRNVATLSVLFYRIDLEVLFSRDPFLDAAALDYSYVAANHVEERRVDGGGAGGGYAVETVGVPAELRGSNLVIQVRGGGESQSLTYFPTRMRAHVNRAFGLVKVVPAEGDGRPLSKVYVKVFARMHDGGVVFFKDGYTDLRGTFEYASVHGGADFASIAEFSILVCSDEYGALLRRAEPPAGVATVDAGARQVLSAKVQAVQRDMVTRAGRKYCM